MSVTAFKHYSHEHKLKLECNETPFTCNACVEVGWGSRYRCQACNYDLHKECALASPTISHPLYKKRVFERLHHVPGNRYCNACGGDVHGLVYHCHKSGHDLHPSCANLPQTLTADGLKLQLHESISSKCRECSGSTQEAIKGWSYKSTCEEYHFHVACVKEMVVKKWEEWFSWFEMNSLDMGITQAPNSLQLVSQSGATSNTERTARPILKAIVSTMFGEPVVASGMTSLARSSLPK